MSIKKIGWSSASALDVGPALSHCFFKAETAVELVFEHTEARSAWGKYNDFFCCSIVILQCRFAFSADCFEQCRKILKGTEVRGVLRL